MISPMPGRGWWYGAGAMLIAAALLALNLGDAGGPPPLPPVVEELPAPAPIVIARVRPEAKAAFAQRRLFGLKERAPDDDSARPVATTDQPAEEPPSAGAEAPGLRWTLRGVVIREGTPRAVFERPGDELPGWIYLAEGERGEGLEVLSIEPDRVRVRSTADGLTYAPRLFAFGGIR